MRIFLAPRSNETSYQNFLSTIENGVDYSRVEPYLNEEGKNLLRDSRKLFVWGNKETKKASWEKLEPNDLVIFYKGRENGEAEGKFVYGGKLLFKQHSKDLGLSLWPPRSGEEPWTCIFFLHELRPVYIPLSDIRKLAGYGDNFVVQGFMPLDEQATAKIISQFGTGDSFLNHYSSRKSDQESGTSDLAAKTLFGSTPKVDLDPRIQEELRIALDTVTRRGDLLSTERLQAAYSTFRSRFGPERLKSYDGEALLNAMFLTQNRESLVYWLEFKNDEEFPGTKLGSIAGGSAHKFGIFKRKETGQWVTGSPQNVHNITEAEAVEVARKYRQQLLAGVEQLEKFPTSADDLQYEQLQDEMGKVAPDIAGLAWAHKYYSLLFPEKLDDYHNHRYQRFNLIKLLQIPPKVDGLYACAGRFVRFAKSFGWPVNHFDTALNERHGRPKNYWRIGTRVEVDSLWESMKTGSFIAIGWKDLGDLSRVISSPENSKEEIRRLLQEHYPGDASAIGKKAAQIQAFAAEIEEDEVVVAADGEQVLGIGTVSGSYRYENAPPTDAPHRRLVNWISTQQWKLPVSEGLRTTVWRLKTDEQNLVEIERRILEAGVSLKATISSPQIRAHRLEDVSGRLQSILERKGQAILYGPPGTGKTYWARKTAFDLASIHSFGQLFEGLSRQQKIEVEGSGKQPGLVRFCTFHPAYGYEDFLEGFRPNSSHSGDLIFEQRDGIFKRICTDAARDQGGRKYYLVIDEINRGDIPRIFGELLTLLELDKRGQTVYLPMSGESFAVPTNVYVIGTMNTADRSIALLDTALRRRFGFVELMPNIEKLGSASIEGSIPLGPWLNALNERIREHLGRDSRNLQIGHAYFLDNSKPVTEFSKFVRILAEDIIPLLEEYCYEDFGALTQILGADFIDPSRLRIREELFAVSHREELVQALLSPSPDIVTTTNAATYAVRSEEPEETDAEDTV